MEKILLSLARLAGFYEYRVQKKSKLSKCADLPDRDAVSYSVAGSITLHVEQSPPAIFRPWPRSDEAVAWRLVVHSVYVVFSLGS